ncbi:hypothetical protein GPECTOR_20g555 [Gonium pectorale]|uniref:Uncharacterized protein n=1 Tax=Gonium pectorale TaxID=33097 RepID=A0A150GIP9_GONPE|nr:hypothetical protein GPECTOR_20g555 [Gonium pectorale]|eukprot:KXZ49698.1 hypothetical protein GPECTOR_20g555 [Gonium pectorale]
MAGYLGLAGLEVGPAGASGRPAAAASGASLGALLRGLPGLQHLSLGVTVPAAPLHQQLLCDALADLPHLHEAALPYGAALPRLLSSLATHPALSRLELHRSGHEMLEESAVACLPRLERLRELSLGSVADPDVLRRLLDRRRGLLPPGLEVLELPACRALDPGGLCGAELALEAGGVVTALSVGGAPVGLLSLARFTDRVLFPSAAVAPQLRRIALAGLHIDFRAAAAGGGGDGAAGGSGSAGGGFTAASAATAAATSWNDVAGWRRADGGPPLPPPLSLPLPPLSASPPPPPPTPPSPPPLEDVLRSPEVVSLRFLFQRAAAVEVGRISVEAGSPPQWVLDALALVGPRLPDRLQLLCGAAPEGIELSLQPAATAATGGAAAAAAPVNGAPPPSLAQATVQRMASISVTPPPPANGGAGTLAAAAVASSEATRGGPAVGDGPAGWGPPAGADGASGNAYVLLRGPGIERLATAPPAAVRAFVESLGRQAVTAAEAANANAANSAAAEGVPPQQAAAAPPWMAAPVRDQATPPPPLRPAVLAYLHLRRPAVVLLFCGCAPVAAAVAVASAAAGEVEALRVEAVLPPGVPPAESCRAVMIRYTGKVVQSYWDTTELWGWAPEQRLLWLLEEWAQLVAVLRGAAAMPA